MAHAAVARHSGDADNKSDRRAWAGWVIQVVCLLYAAFVVFENVQECLWHWPSALVGEAGRLGVSFGEDPVGGGYYLVQSVEPAGAMAKSGVAKGDLVRFDRPFDVVRKFRAGEVAGFTLREGAKLSHRTVSATPRAPGRVTAQSWLSLAYDLATALAALFGAFILWRSRRNTTTMLLGMALLTYGLISYSPELPVSAPNVFPFFEVQGIANIYAIPILFWAFAAGFYGDHVAPPKRWERIAFFAYAAAVFLVVVASLGEIFAGWSWPIPGGFRMTAVVVTYAGFAVCLTYIVLGWRRSAASIQQRYALMLVATSAIIGSQALDSLIPTGGSEAIKTFHLITNAFLTGVVGAGLFAYSILRHRVLDLGFAINRTLVYGMVSAILLAAFGLIEWAVDHFVPIEGREKNAIIDAVIAVGVFLTFHRVRDLVERVIEGLFFRSWQKAEATLRRFVREAAFITDSAELTRAFVKALSKYADGAEAAVYLLEERRYVLAGGSIGRLSKRLNPNLPFLVSVRAEPRPQELHDEPDARVAAPMINRNEVFGLAMLGPKPSGQNYRPDEVELIGWAAHQVGLDLHALEVERFANLAAQLRQENATLRSLIPQRA